ncbi:NAD-dependent epimerase/dehydratase family protein [Nocardia sp. NPDC020380]|uniref:NAD-dependent epimerase/dehydratase family protein n=1 Tax=Nocardia sp. NPDC020380 TaxID=3364309 RepID=UPI0037A54E50
MRALVTGAAGFIGSNLVDRLLADGHDVVGVDNLRTGSTANLAAAEGAGARFAFVECDITAPELVGLVAVVHPEVVFHLAAQVDVRKSVADPWYDARVNVLGTVNLLEASRRAQVRRVVYAASGGSRYGRPESLPVQQETAANPVSPYAAAKVAGEYYLHAYTGLYGMSGVSLALANVYGPHQDPHGEAGVVAIFGSALLTGRPTAIFGDGSATRDYIYVSDVVDAFVRAAAAPPDVAGTFNVGTGLQTSTLQLHELIAQAIGVRARPSYRPARAGEIDAIALDCATTVATLQWQPRVAVREGVARTIEWLRGALAASPVV